MLTYTPDSSLIHEIIRKQWPQDNTDSSQLEESNWEILDENSDHDALKRHWFKQNYINQNPRNGSMITYH